MRSLESVTSVEAQEYLRESSFKIGKADNAFEMPKPAHEYDENSSVSGQTVFERVRTINNISDVRSSNQNFQSQSIQRIPTLNINQGHIK